MKRKLFSKIRIATSLHLIVALLAFFIGGQIVNAAALTSFSDTMTRLAQSTLSNHTIVFTTPTGVAAGQTIKLTFQSDFTLDPFMDFNSVDFGTTTAATSTLANTASGGAWGVATTTNTVTFTSGTAVIPAASTITIRIGTNATFQSVGTKQITNTTTTGNKTIAVTGTFTDTGTTTIPIISNDQMALTAQVDGSITFTISANTASFGTLSASAARFASSTAAGDSVEATSTILTVGTNATNGFTMTINSGSANQGTLTSGANTIATTSANTASTVGSEQFGVRLSVFGGTNVTVAAPYAAAGFAFDSVNFPQTVGSAPNATANATFGVRYIANIASNTEAGAYTATHTYVATANF